MTTIIETRGGGDEFLYRHEVTEEIELDSAEYYLGKLATDQSRAYRIVFGPALRSVVQPEPLRNIPFADPAIQTN